MTAQALDSLELPARFSFEQQGDFFHSVEWFHCLAATAVKNPPRVYTAGDIALVCCWSGSTLRSLTNYYTPEFGPLGKGGLEDIAQHIAVDRPVRVRLEFLPEEVARASSKALEGAGFFVRPYFMHENWYVRLQGRNFEAYFSDRPSQTTNTIRRRWKKLAASHDCRIVLSRDAGCIDDFVSVYESSWKRPEPHGEFIPALARTCASLGVLRLGILYVDGVPAASQVWITTARKALIYKLAYKEQFRQFSVGSILSHELFRQAIDVDGVEEIDYGVGSEPYKRDWMEERRSLYGVVAYNLRTVSGMALAAAEKTKWIMHRLTQGARQRAAEQDAGTDS